MEIRYFTSGKNNIYIKEENGLITQIIRFLDNMCIDIMNFEGDKRYKRRVHSGQFEIEKYEYEFWSDIAFRIKEFNRKRYST